jgi:hypothetical protein
MAESPSLATLYRTWRRIVTFGILLLILALASAAQVARRPKKSTGPRALALLEMLPGGKVRLIPVTIMYDGEFYDATAYKASPLPMALEYGTVYEAQHAGVSQGLFTVNGALHSADNQVWIGEGTWQDAASLAAREKKQPAASKPSDQELDDAPPVLRHGAPARPKPPETAPAPTSPSPAPASPAASGSEQPGTPAAAPAPAASPAPAQTPHTAVAENPPEDPERPMLRRGKPAPHAREPFSTSSVLAAAKPVAPTSTAPKAGTTAPVQLVAAISDADGPEPRPYTYSMKPEEEQQFRKKMLDMAAEELRAYSKQQTSGTIGPAQPKVSSPSPRRTAAATNPPLPNFDDVQLKVFDLSGSNEPILVLTATAHFPQRAALPEGSPPPPLYYLALIARDDIYGELHKAFANVTDLQHLDVTPRIEFIDAVDADGDGRGELLFRRVSDTGTAFAIYRVIGNQLWPLFQSTPAR